MLHSASQSRRSLTRRMALWLVATGVVACGLPTVRFIQVVAAEAQAKPGADATGPTPSAQGGRTESGAKVDPAAPAAKETIPREKLRYGGLGFDEWKELITTDLDPETRAKACNAFAAFGLNGYPGEAVAVIGAALETEREGRVRQAAYQALANVGAAGVPLLVEALRHGDTYWAAEALKKFTGPARAKMAVPAIPALVEATHDQSTNVRRFACQALGNIVAGDQSKRSVELAVPALIERLKEKFDDRARPFDRGAQESAIVALGQIGPSAAAAVPALVEALQTNWLSRGRYPSGASPEQVIIALGQIGPAAKAAIPLLTEMAQKRTDKLALRARQALEKIQAETPSAEESPPAGKRGE
jgi:HEAT repeat protein